MHNQVVPLCILSLYNESYISAMERKQMNFGQKKATENQ